MIGETCIHFWTIATPEGPGGSLGICSNCGEAKMFSNVPVFSDFIQPRRRRREDVIDDDSNGETSGDGETGSRHWDDEKG
jgi:hypothetical protein